MTLIPGEVKVYAALGLVTVLAAGVAFFGYHERSAGKAEQLAKDQPQIASLQADYAGCGQSLAQVNADAKTAAAKAQQEKDNAAQVVAQSQADAATAAKAAATWEAKFRAASKTPACAGLLQVTICPALFEPAPSSSR